MRSHDLDVLSLMAGVAFVGLSLAALLGDGAGVEARWACPVVLIVVGVIGLAASRRDTRKRHHP